MTKVGINYMYWYGTGADGDTYQTLELTAAAGADVMEYNAPMLAAMTRQERLDLRRAAAEKGLEIAVTGGMGAGFNLAAESEQARRDSIKLARKAIEVCTDVGSADWCGVIYAKWLDIPEKPLTQEFRADVWKRSVTSLKEVMKVAEANNVIVSMEILNRFEVFLLTTVEQGLEFAKDIDSPMARLLLDTFHMNIEEDDMVESIKKAISLEKMGHLHVTEANRRPPGLVKTAFDWGRILGAVRESDYKGIVSLEPFVLMSAPNAVPVRTWRDLIDHPDRPGVLEAAQRSVAFVKGHLSRPKTI